ncbi:MAG: hypothetical protein QNJ51_26595 [Calothrix sp. MO_167.B12]|nr:hypothetical protein [Calothrix sp. MO_167.B12]
MRLFSLWQCNSRTVIGRVMGRWGDGEMGRWGDGEMGRWGGDGVGAGFPRPEGRRGRIIMY